MHYLLLVVTDTKPSKAEIGGLLAAFGEVDSEDDDDSRQFEVDVTDELLDSWNEPETALRLPGGKLVSPNDPQFQEWAARFLGERPGAEKRALWLQGLFDRFVKVEEHSPAEIYAAQGRTLADYAAEYPAVERDGRYFERDDPTGRFDGWQIGGRWNGLFTPGYEPELDSANRETCDLCGGTGKRTDMVVPDGCNGCQGSGVSVKWPTEWREVGVQARVGDIDLAALRAAGQPSCCALLIDGQWRQAGDDEQAWISEVEKLIGTLPQTAWLTAVDCHS